MRLVWIAALLAACQDQGVSVINNEPTAEITSHQDGDEVPGGVPVEFRGAAGDAEDDLETLTATWFVDGAVACEGAPPDANGVTSCIITVPGAQATVMLEVRDPAASSATDEVSLSACVDEWWQDDDGDGFGNPEVSQFACSQPLGFVANMDDCDDTNRQMNAGAIEVCGDGLDNDCSGKVDDGCLGSNCFDDDDVIVLTDNYFQIAGTLRDTDRLDTATGSYADDYEFEGLAGDELAVHAWSDAVDTYVELYDQNCELYQDIGDGARDTNAFLRFRLPTAGIWTVVVRSEGAAEMGNFVLEMLTDSADLGANCALETFTMDVESAPYTDTFSGSLASGDQLWGSDVGTGFYFDDVELFAFYGDTLDTTHSSTAFDAILNLYSPTCGLVTYAQDGGGGTNARITQPIDQTGIYTYTAWAEYSWSTGNYNVTAAATW
jgi:hypothetical protein